MAEVTVIAGPARTGKTRAQLERYRGALLSQPPGSALWLAPNRRSAAEVRASLLDARLRACMAPQVYTFEQFAEQIVAAAREPIRRISPLMKRQLVREIVDRHAKAGQLKHFGSIAATSGVLDIFCRMIGELKRLEIWPEDFERACKAGGMRAKDREIAAVYFEYQQILNDHRLYDAEGRFWWAHEQLRQGHTRSCERIRLVIADGFADFTRSQHEILANLAQRAESVVITLALEEGSARRDLFAKSQRTLEQLRARHKNLKVESLQAKGSRSTAGQATSAGRASTWLAMEHVERHLFGDPRRPVRAADTAGFEIVAASGQLGEIEQIAGRIKQLIAPQSAKQSATAKPGDVVVVFRSLSDAAPLVREVFTERGIPFAIDAGIPLVQVPAVAALVNVLRLTVEDWPYRRLLSVLCSNYFQPRWRERTVEATAAAEYMIRHSQIPAGRDALLDALRRWTKFSAKQDTDEEDGSRLRLLRKRAGLALPLLDRLKATLDGLPDSATCAQWIEPLAQVATDLGILPHDADGSNDCDQDQLAWEALVAGLQESDRLARWTKQDCAAIDRAGMVTRILEIAGETALGTYNETGCVRVVSATAARGLRPAYLFLAGLSEKAFPSPDRGDGLYSEGEHQRLIAGGLPLQARGERSQDEMLLFYEVITSATKHVCLSYPALDDSAGPLSPSPYLIEVERACGPRAIHRTDAPDLSPIPRTDNPCSPSEWRVRAMADALDEKGESLSALVADEPSKKTAANILAGLDVIDRRGPGDEFSAFEGMLLSESAHQAMSRRFGPNQCWSASGLEQFASCPYQFFANRILHLEPLPDLVLEVDYLVRGRILHDTLARLHRSINALTGSPCSPRSQDPAQLEQLYAKTLEELIERLHAYNPLDTALREVDRRLLIEWSKQYFQQHETYDETWKTCDAPLAPAHFEVSFGSDRLGKDADPLSTDKTFVLEHDGETILLSGRIDRIDLGRVGGQTVFNILDYKSGASGKLSRDTIEAGLALQLPLYAIVAQELLLADRKAVPWRVGYWFVKKHGYRDKDALKMYEHDGGQLRPSDEWQTLRTSILDRVVSLVRAVRSAQFPVISADDECTSRCDYRTVCRVGQVRALEKAWQAPSRPVH